MNYIPEFENSKFFITTTVHNWIDIFTRPIYKHIIVDSLEFCQKHKGLIIFSWCLMSNHIHLILSSQNGFNLSETLRDFKKHTSRTIIKTIQENRKESRKQWLLNQFEYAGRFNKKIKDFKFWQDGYDSIELYTNAFMMQKLNYIHQNPVKAEIVDHPEDYLYSSAKNYAHEKGLIEVEILS